MAASDLSKKSSHVRILLGIFVKFVVVAGQPIQAGKPNIRHSIAHVHHFGRHPNNLY